jgi:DivIVA domain-containing protein
VVFVFMLVGFAVIAVVSLLAVGRLGELPDAEPDRAPLALPEDRPMAGDDVDAVRFAVAVRGYRMDEVDDVLDRLADDITLRDARIAELESRLGDPDPGPAPDRGGWVEPSPVPETDDIDPVPAVEEHDA